MKVLLIDNKEFIRIDDIEPIRRGVPPYRIYVPIKPKLRLYLEIADLPDTTKSSQHVTFIHQGKKYHNGLYLHYYLEE